jgi:hypothetical protein
LKASYNTIRAPPTALFEFFAHRCPLSDAFRRVENGRFRHGLLAGSDALSNQAGEQGRFTAQVAHSRSLDHFFFGTCRSPVDVVAGLQPELANEFVMRSAIAVTKQICGIQLSDEIGSAVDKLLRVKSNKMLLGRELRQNLQQRRCEESSWKMCRWIAFRCATSNPPVMGVSITSAMRR